MKVICEVGSNWHILEDCIKSIKLAKEAGSHTVKFQYFSSYDLYGPASDLRDLSKIGETPYMPKEWIQILRDEARRQDIGFMCTAFSVYGYEYINSFVEVHKIASAELTDTNILKTVNRFKKPVYLSTAGSSLEDIRNALTYLKDCPVTIMFCVGDYPAKIVDFRILQRMKEFFGDLYSYGYSDHSIDILNIPIIARYSGCTVIEKHVNLIGATDTNDAGHSLSFDELRLMCSHLAGTTTMEDTGALSNKMMKSLYKRRFVVTKPIKAGDKFLINDNVGIYRPTRVWSNAVTTFRHWDIEGKISNRDKDIGDVVCEDDIDVEPN